MASINLHTKYAKKVGERFSRESLTESSFSKKYDMEFVGNKTVKITSIETVDMNNYTRSGANRYGNPAELEDTVSEYTMNRDRSFSFTIDKGNNKEQDMVKNAGKALARQLREKVTPEIDMYRFEKWAAGAGGSDTIDPISEDNILKLILAGTTFMDNSFVPQNGRTLYVGSEAYNAVLLNKFFVALEKTGNKALVKGKVGELFDMDVKKIPDSYLPENVAFMIIHKDAAISPMKLHEYKVHQDPPGISGHLVEGRFIYDAFVLEHKKNGIYVAKTA